jgi:predicted regulator of Ras-like GTPase activity (Roadblock/LC7/MglB family)
MTSRSDQSLRDEALVFYEEDIESLQTILDAFLKKSAAHCALLVDKDGHMITWRGQRQNVDLDTISALVAGSFAATKQLAHQFGEDEFTALFHQGRGRNLQLSLVADRALLTALFGDDTTVGMVRLYATEAAKRLGEVFRRKIERRGKEGGRGAGNGLLGEGSFLGEGADALDDVLGGD